MKADFPCENVGTGNTCFHYRDRVYNCASIPNRRFFAKKSCALALKVGLFRNVFGVFQKTPKTSKNELENLNFCPSLLGQKFFVRFLEELKTQKSPFEIN